MRYIELNPVRAAMVEGPAHYRWSSYRANGPRGLTGARGLPLTYRPVPYIALLQVSSQDGTDMMAQVDALRTGVMETLVKGKPARLENARSRLREAQAVNKPVAKVRPPVERMKQMIQEIFARDPSIGLAYREGKQQSEADWQSLCMVLGRSSA